jgi:methyl-accepting chemotaxis protein
VTHLPIRFTAMIDPAGLPRHLSDLAAQTEAAFLSCGTELQAASTALARMKRLFAEVEAGLGPESGATFAAHVRNLGAGADDLASALSAFIDRAQLLDQATRSANRQIGDLDRVVRTIATLAITARVIGHAMSPPEPKVAAFVENLSQMSAEAETILSDVKAAMEDIRQDMDAFAPVADEVQRLLAGQVVQELDRLTRAAHTVQARRPALLLAGQNLGSEMTLIGAEVARLILALQSGDAFRQRLDRVGATVSGLPDLMSDPARAARLGLSEALLSAAAEDVGTEARSAVGSLEELDRGATAALRLAREAYLEGGEANAGGGALAVCSRVLDARLAEVDQLLVCLRQQADRVVAKVQDIVSREVMLRHIAQQVRLAGLNAVVICTQLGSRANALREVAQWLRIMTDEADDITAGLHDALARMDGMIGAVGGEGLKALSSGMAEVVAAGQALQSEITGTTDLIARARDAMQDLRAALGGGLARAGRELGAFLQGLEMVSPALAGLRAAQAALPPAEFAPEPGSLAALQLDSLRRAYTMQAERLIHDRLFVSGPQGTSLPDLAPGEASAEAEESLDDILF